MTHNYYGFDDKKAFSFPAFITYIPESAGLLNRVSLKALGFKLNLGTKNEMKRKREHIWKFHRWSHRVDFEQERKPLSVVNAKGEGAASLQPCQIPNRKGVLLKLINWRRFGKNGGSWQGHINYTNEFLILPCGHFSNSALWVTPSCRPGWGV